MPAVCVSGGGLGMHENSAPLFWLNFSSALFSRNTLNLFTYTYNDDSMNTYIIPSRREVVGSGKAEDRRRRKAQ